MACWTAVKTHIEYRRRPEVDESNAEVRTGLVSGLLPLHHHIGHVHVVVGHPDGVKAQDGVHHLQ